MRPLLSLSPGSAATRLLLHRGTRSEGRPGSGRSGGPCRRRRTARSNGTARPAGVHRSERHRLHRQIRRRRNGLHLLGNRLLPGWIYRTGVSLRGELPAEGNRLCTRAAASDRAKPGPVLTAGHDVWRQRDHELRVARHARPRTGGRELRHLPRRSLPRAELTDRRLGGGPPSEAGRARSLHSRRLARSPAGRPSRLEASPAGGAGPPEMRGILRRGKRRAAPASSGVDPPWPIVQPAGP